MSLDKSERSTLASKLRETGGCFVSAPPAGADAYLCWALLEAFPGHWIWVVDGAGTLDRLHRDCLAFAGDREERLHLFPALEDDVAGDPVLTGQRLDCLRAYANPPEKGIVLTCIQALMQPTLSPHAIAQQTVNLALMKTADPAELAEQLLDMGYTFTHEVHEQGEASRRGGLLDVWPLTESWPVRLEFFGDILESIRTFDPADQTSIEKIEHIDLTPAAEIPADGTESPTYLVDHLHPGSRWAWHRPEELEKHAAIYLAAEESDEDALPTGGYSAIRKRTGERFREGHIDLLDFGADIELAFAPTDGLSAPASTGLHPDLMEQARNRYVKELLAHARDGDKVHVFFDTDGAQQRFLQMYPEAETADIKVHVAPLSEGFTYAPQRLVAIAESDIYGYRKTRRRTARKIGARKKPATSAGPAFASWTDIQPGEMVVHADHGIGKYLGLYEIEFQGQEQEVLAVEYAGRARLYVPVSQTHLLSRYVGVGKKQPELHRLGGSRWMKQKTNAERAIHDMAASLLETQAARETLKGHAFPADTNWQHEFESAFPYTETEDQARAIEEVKHDMESQRPMDRLICGDVGYGKTEVAMRAAFKAVMNNRQVAVLVPTTVLAQQHFFTFSERMSAFPVTIEMLSRFRTRKQQAEIIAGLREGQVDIVIGTHRLVQPDVKFKNLGLVIIDEEQRFGVSHKERLKQLRKLVDVLTMTATPIPRTLYMSLTGAKDMSTIQTPPRERLPVETIVSEKKDSVIRHAVLRELNREGQIFYLHNRVKTIHREEQHLRELLPEARIAVGHGQMSERTLAAIMRRFIAGEIDMLLCTTIIESGVDIPNVNTIFIDRADRFGMADLYQLRGRVGRYKHKAYAYLLLPRHGELFAAARKRIQAIKRYSSLGAGFKLALRDLEIRGAGNLLGAQQSGHIAAVGFDLYCQLLRQSIDRMQGKDVQPLVEVELQLDFIDLAPSHADDEHAAVIPYTYMEDENHRVSAYRRLAAAITSAEVDALEKEFADRFGPVPRALKHLLLAARVRVIAARHNITHLETRGDKLMMTRHNDYLMRNHRFPRLSANTSAKRLKEIAAVIQQWDSGN
jgi:transcription-repair coupling factor (superfamily II helicase)